MPLLRPRRGGAVDVAVVRHQVERLQRVVRRLRPNDLKADAPTWLRT